MVQQRRIDFSEAAHGVRQFIFRVAVPCWIGFVAAAQTASETPAEAAARWVAANAIPIETVEAGYDSQDLQPLKEIVGNARIVALGESTHGTREFFQLKHRIFEFLVREMGFTAMGMELTMPESFDLNRYVLTGEGDPVRVLSNTHYWVFDAEEVLDLIRWMRNYNRNPANARKVTFYGFDIQFSGHAARVVLAYLRRVDPAEASSVEPVLHVLSNPLTHEDYALSKLRIEQYSTITVGILNALMNADQPTLSVRARANGAWFVRMRVFSHSFWNTSPREGKDRRAIAPWPRTRNGFSTRKVLARRSLCGLTTTTWACAPTSWVIS